ncbi:MAG TPA: TolC family protein [Candidatus Limnocylindria bacterium]|nr:TolC family protein [Candidatus Limnocylindria bacterium]
MIGRHTHFAMAILTAASLVVSPVYAQSQGVQDQGAQTQSTSQPQTQAQAGTSATDQSRNLKSRLGRDYSNGPGWFPNFTSPYAPVKMPETMLTNSPRLDQLVQDGKLMLSLEDAISIALENNLDISVQRFTPWIAQTQVLKAKAGGIPQSGSSQQIILGSGPSVSFDPIFTSGINWSRSSNPVNNPFLSGTGTTATPILTNYNANYNFGYVQGFHTGTNVSITFDNNRASTTSPSVLFNPSVQSTMTFTVTQPLLNGFGLLPNTRFIIESKNNLKIADSQFEQQVIATVQAVSNDYWELVFARENVKVEEAAVAVSTKLYGDNKKQLEIGTMAPLDVLTAESQLATDTQNLIVAQTNKLQQETILLVAITKNPLAANLTAVEIVPTTPISVPNVENITLEAAVKEAWQKRPELQQASLNLKNAEIEVKGTRNSLLPSLNLFGQYSSTGLGGNQITSTATGAFVADQTAPIVDIAGAPVNIPPFAFVGTPLTTAGAKPGGLNDSLNSMINNNFPTYAVGINFTLPIRNRSAQADSGRALLTERQLQVQYRSTQNQIVLGVRNALIALQQDKAQVAAAAKARELAQQTLDAEQKKYQLGSSTSYNVVLRARDLTAAQGTELRAKANLEEAVVNLDQAMGRTLEVNHIIVADARRGKVQHEFNIPGTPEPEPMAGK